MSIAKECRRIFVSGAKCRALAVKGTNYCFFHQAARDFHRENVSRHKSIVVPPIEDRASIHVAIQATLDAIGSNRMDPARARAYLYGLQLAMQNLGKDGLPYAAEDSVTNPACADGEEFLAPEEDCLDECGGSRDLEAPESRPHENSPSGAAIPHPPACHPDDPDPERSEREGEEGSAVALALASSKLTANLTGHLTHDGPCSGISRDLQVPESSATDLGPSAPDQIDAASALPEGEGRIAQDFSPGSAPIESLSPVGTMPTTVSPSPMRKPLAVEPASNEQSIDISASADEKEPTAYQEPLAPSLARYGLARIWQCEERELTDDELRKHQYVDGLINHTLRALYAAQPFRSQADRRRLREQTRCEFYNSYLVPEPEPRACTVTTRYQALLLS